MIVCDSLSLSECAADKHHQGKTASLWITSQPGLASQIHVYSSAKIGSRFQRFLARWILQEANHWSESGQWNHHVHEVFKKPLHYVPHCSLLLNLSHCSRKNVGWSREWRYPYDPYESNVHTLPYLAIRSMSLIINRPFIINLLYDNKYHGTGEPLEKGNLGPVSR